MIDHAVYANSSGEENSLHCSGLGAIIGPDGKRGRHKDYPLEKCGG